MRYASPEQISVLVNWTVHGPRSLDPSPGNGNHNSYQRRASLTAIRQLIEYWGLGPEYERLRQEVMGRDITHISEALRLELVRHARIRGFVLRGGEAAVPLFGMQLEVLARIAWGGTLESLASDMRIGRKAASEHTWRMRRDTGTNTTAELVACAYRNEWLPYGWEMRELGTRAQLDLFDADRVRFLGPRP